MTDQGSPLRVACRGCGSAIGEACILPRDGWMFCLERVDDVRALLLAERAPRVVTQRGPELLIDGAPVRTIAPPADPCLQQPRGQRRRRGKK